MARVFASLDVNDVVGVGCESVGIEIPEGLNCCLKVGFGSGFVGGRELEGKRFGSGSLTTFAVTYREKK